MVRGTAAPPTRIARRLERSTSSAVSATRNTSFHTVGTPSEMVGRSSRTMARIGPPWRNIWGMISSTPAKNAVYTVPQALTWNIGTMTRQRSRSHRPIVFAVDWAIECSQVERCE